MIAKIQENPLASQAYLVLLYGSTDAGPRQYPLDRDAVVIGKSQGCDLVLQAPDVSQLHCVITRNAGGWTIRDCNSRSGVRLNGDKVCEASLHDDAILHVGPFSFRVVLPAQRCDLPSRGSEARLLKLTRQRRNLARLALHQRRRWQQLKDQLRELQAQQNHDDERVNLTHPTEALQQCLRDAQERGVELERGERELAHDRALLERELEEFRERVQKKDQELRDRQTGLEKEWQQRLADLDREAARLRAAEPGPPAGGEVESVTEPGTRVQAWEEEQSRREPCLLRSLEGPPSLPEPDLEKTQVLPAGREQEEVRRLHLRQQELDFFVQHLQRTRQRLKEDQRRLEQAQQLLTRGIQEMQNEQQENLVARERWAQVHADALEQLRRQQTVLMQSEEMLREQRESLLQMMGEVQQLHEQLRPQDEGELAALRRENEELARRLEENEQERLRLQARFAQDASFLGEMEHIHKENEVLRKLLEEKDSLMEELRQQAQGPADNPSVLEISGGYEAELIKFRRQLEADRAKLGEEIQALRQRNEELDQANREMEMQFSRERAELARERTRLDRMREEVRTEIERLQKDGGLTDRLAPFQKLREEINERRQAALPPPKENGLVRSLRNLGNRS